VGGRLQHVHFLGGEFIEHRFVPVRLLAGMPREPRLFHLALPVRSGCCRNPAHLFPRSPRAPSNKASNSSQETSIRGAPSGACDFTTYSPAVTHETGDGVEVPAPL